MKSFRFLFLFLILFSAALSYAQPIEKIKFAKNPGIFYFFQKGLKNDTILKDRSDLFYLLVPDSMKPGFSLSVENGRLIRTANDSVLKFEHLPGLKYETFYVKIEAQQNGLNGRKGAKNTAPTMELKTLINGTTDKEKNLILIRISDKKSDKVLLENIFYYR